MRAAGVVAILSLAALAQLAPAKDPSRAEWEQYKRRFGKVYASEEEDARRFSIFSNSSKKVREHNGRGESYTKELNQLSDWTADEFRKLVGLRKGAKQRRSSSEAEAFLRQILDDPSPVAAEVDWRKVANRVGPVKDQCECGSCWAFATTGLLEGQQVARNNFSQLVPLSEQYLVDCGGRNYGCCGGFLDEALEDIRDLGGIGSDDEYPYLGLQGLCLLDPDTVVMTVKGSVILPADDELALARVVARYGPVATGITATDNLSSYKSGVFVDERCQTEREPNHAVLIVGYGSSPKEGDFWILKNSWSKGWGEDGYFRVQRGVGMCALGSSSTIATF